MSREWTEEEKKQYPEAYREHLIDRATQRTIEELARLKYELKQAVSDRDAARAEAAQLRIDYEEERREHMEDLRGQEDLCNLLEAARAEAARLRSALDHYAAEENWFSYPRSDRAFEWQGPGEQGWTVAREALAGSEEETT